VITLELLEVQALTSPNIYSLDQDIILLKVKLGDLIDTSTKDIPGFNEKVIEFFPGIREHKCTKGYTGYMCGECSANYYRSGTRCYECDSFADLLLFMAIVITIILLVFLFAVSYRPSKSTRFAALRIGWSFIQVTALYAQFELNWPKEIKDIYKYLSFVILDIQITSPECSIGVSN
jgi:hypothetical protein